MSINASDFSKQGLNYSLKPEQRAAEDFAALRQANAKVVQNTADISRADKDNRNSQNFNSSTKIEPHDVEIMNQKMSQLNVHLTFEITEDRAQNIVKVLDQTTGDVVRQIPTEEFLKMSDRIDAIMSQLSDIKGTLVNSEV
ncbi:flagellar biosynthesis protein FlaG [Marinomonas sp. UCMA 3892]|jgi:flagellar protein FlaG|uniref:Flagellar protein FlaG protein n=1 Tax=Marinomonas sp. (strain MWYL1) TaxID=400668 RepID=A6W192_MARMS|nr:flagellar protein FlaG [Marinomonas sp. UCMA 3892]NLU99841.1 flagellar biosynthesis protein FlaG [Marinomonas sp. UCMA 3892]